MSVNLSKIVNLIVVCLVFLACLGLIMMAVAQDRSTKESVQQGEVKPRTEYEKARKILIALEAQCELYHRGDSANELLRCVRNGIDAHLEDREFSPYNGKER
jgi:hypothetical protein